MTYDLFCFNGEYDMLEIRFNILDKFVDYFVLGESTETFSGKEKPLYYELNKEKFAQWNSKIIHIISPKIEASNAFIRAGFQKEYLKNGLKKAKPDDLIYYGDVDEIWNHQHEPKEGKLRQLNYSYYLNNSSSEVWEGTNVFRYKRIRNLNDIRADHSVIVENGGWHFTNLMNYEQLINKLESYDHQECNIPWVKDGLKYRMEANIDYLGRTADWQGKPFKLWKEEKDLPKYILDNKKLWIEKKLWKL